MAFADETMKLYTLNMLKHRLDYIFTYLSIHIAGMQECLLQAGIHYSL